MESRLHASPLGIVSSMANSEHLAILAQGVESWNTWLHRHPEVVPDFIGADLREINLDVAVYVHPQRPAVATDASGTRPADRG